MIGGAPFAFGAHICGSFEVYDISQVNRYRSRRSYEHVNLDRHNVYSFDNSIYKYLQSELGLSDFMTLQTNQPFISTIDGSGGNIGIGYIDPIFNPLEPIMQESPSETVHKMESNKLQHISIPQPRSRSRWRTRTDGNRTINIMYNCRTDLRHQDSRIGRHHILIRFVRSGPILKSHKPRVLACFAGYEEIVAGDLKVLVLLVTGGELLDEDVVAQTEG